jgi:Fe-Mn family superoxide dismutase
LSNVTQRWWTPTGELLEAIESDFGSFDEFKLNSVKLSDTIWFRMGLVVCTKGGKLDVCGTPNQDNPLMPGICGGTQF